MFDPIQIAEEAVNMSLNQNKDLNKAIGELAKKSSLNSEQIKRVVELANNMLYKEKFKQKPIDVLNLSLANASQLNNHASEILKVAQSINEDSITGERIASTIDNIGPDFIKKATTRARLKQLKSDLSGDIISSFIEIERGVESAANDIVNLFLSKEAQLTELYEIVESNCPNLTRAIINKVNERLNDSFIKYAFDGELIGTNFKGRVINANNPLVLKLRWLNETMDDIRAKLEAYSTVNAALEKSQGGN